LLESFGLGADPFGDGAEGDAAGAFGLPGLGVAGIRIPVIADEPVMNGEPGYMANSLLRHDKTEGHVYGFADADAGGDGDRGGVEAVVEDAEGGFGAGDVETVFGQGDAQGLAESAGAGAE